MPLLILHPPALPTLGEPPDCDEVALTVSDSTGNYSSVEGEGAWIFFFLGFLADIVRERMGLAAFDFSDSGELDENSFSEIEDPYLRSLLIAFTNKHYESWRDNDVSVPDFSDVRSDSREYCNDCDSGWTETYGTYDGPLPENVENDEDENEAGISAEERAARHERNQHRERERRRRERNREEAESEVIDRELTCDDDCDSFYEHVGEVLRDGIDFDGPALKRRWEGFLKEIGETAMPELMPEVHHHPHGF